MYNLSLRTFPRVFCGNMATRRLFGVSFSLEIYYNYNSSVTCDGSICGLINSEMKVLQMEVKSLTEIVNILNNGLKTISHKEAKSGLRPHSFQMKRTHLSAVIV
jgi:hypothetical protein